MINSPLVVLPELFGPGDILRLRGLVAPQQQQHQPVALQPEVDTISRTEIDSQFVNALTHCPIVPEVAQPRPVQSHTNLGAPLNISKVFKPFPERLSVVGGDVIVNLVRIRLHRL